MLHLQKPEGFSLADWAKSSLWSPYDELAIWIFLLPTPFCIFAINLDVEGLNFLVVIGSSSAIAYISLSTLDIGLIALCGLAVGLRIMLPVFELTTNLGPAFTRPIGGTPNWFYIFDTYAFLNLFCLILPFW